MSNFTEITNNPADACPSALKWSVPSAWSNSTSSNYTQAACAVPACDNFPSTLADCCGRADSDLQYFNTTLGPYAACALADGTNLEAYQAFQECLTDKEVGFFKCNSQEENARSDCGTASANASRALKICCSNYGSVDGFVVYDNGCHVGCVSNSTNGTFSDCVAKEFKGHPGFICTSNDGRENPNTSAGVRDQPSFAGIFTILLLGSSMLML
ncbi:hypothetical protein E4T44_10152 [Aureobasidium sp. EXF-8845]|nr:hypothetical protein E4T44_10152 [Aureobasidium sp. EXF-8845]KAI4836050.1 hypothetical protein E4T45_09912 [Aureobasidium sp. EXF-8846]